MKLRRVFLPLTLALVASFTSAVAATPALSGKILDSANRPISGVQVKITQAGADVSTLTTAADGAYSFNLNVGSYSMQLLPPAGYSLLYAYNISVPQSQALNFTLTPPIPGRAFLTGHVVASKGFVLDYTNSNIGFGNSSAYLKDQAGTYYLTPTAGTTSTFAISGTVSGGDTTFKMIGKTPLALNQDAMVEFTAPFFKQRIRVVTSTGQPVAGSYITGGVGSLTDSKLANAPMNSIEGVGAFDGSWRITGTALQTDSNGYVTLTALQMTNPAPASFWVSGSSVLKYASQSFNTTVGNGDITLTLSQPLPSLTGTVKDSSGKPIPGITLGLTTNNPGTSVQSGSGTTPKADGSFEIVTAANDNYILSVNYVQADDPNKTFVFKTWGDKTNASVPQDKNLNAVVPIQSTRVRVLDPAGQPIANSYVSLKPNPSSFTEYTGKLTILAGRPALNAYTYSTGVTDANGYVTLPTLKFDSEVDGLLFAAPPTGSPLTYSSMIQKIGAGKDISITLSRPLVNISGKFTLSDGAPFLDRVSLGFSNGKGDSASLTRDASGNYSGKVAKGITGSWWIGCGPIDRNLKADFRPCLGGGPTIVSNTDIKQDISLPTYKTSIQIVDAYGRGIPNVSVLLNTDMAAAKNSAQIIQGQTPFSAYFLASATTDATGYALVESLKMTNVQKAYLLVTPDPTSRYQTRDLWINVGDGSKAVVVLEIPKPVINGVSISIVNGVKIATIIGDNFLGVFSVTAGAFSFNDFTNKVGVKTTQGFTVLDKNRITFPIPSGLNSAVVTVTNGGGAATSAVVKFN
jgi:protocatechuate 3,4-dioxygenase beta subunit